MGNVEGIQKNSEGVLKIYPAISLDELYVDAECPSVIKQAIGTAAVWQVRNETSVEKAVSAPSLLPELTLVLLVMDAQVLLGDGTTVPMTTFIDKSGKRGKMAALLISDARCAATARLGVSPTSEPIVAVAVSVDVNDDVVKDLRVALAGVWPRRKWLAESVQTFNGMEAAKLDVEQVAAAVEKEVEPKGDYLGTSEYRSAMAGVLTRQALEACLKGAK
jgi:CO/xanthine dehydrogenase FAD-binding subunit